MTFVREVDQGVNWPEQRERADKAIAEIAEQLEIGDAPLDPETWGLQPAQMAAAERTMRLGGSADAGS